MGPLHDLAVRIDGRLVGHDTRCPWSEDAVEGETVFRLEVPDLRAFCEDEKCSSTSVWSATS